MTIELRKCFFSSMVVLVGGQGNMCREYQRQTQEVFNCKGVSFNMDEFQSFFSKTFLLKQSSNLDAVCF